METEEKSVIVQAHKISRAAYSMPVIQRRLVYLAMSFIRPEDTDFVDIELSVSQLIKVLGMSDNEKTYNEFRTIAQKAMSQVLYIENDDGWEMYNWFDYIKYIESTDMIQMKLDHNLKDFAFSLKKAFYIFDLNNIIKLTGKYALRIYELIMTNYGFVGKEGNKKNEWYFDINFKELRTIFKIEDNEYKVTSDFRKWVIDNPVKEINSASIGITITCEYDRFRVRRKLLGVRFLCKESSTTSSSINEVKRKPKPKPKIAPQENERDLIDENPELWQSCLATAVDELKDAPDFRKSQAAIEAAALKNLKELKGDNSSRIS